MSHALTQLATAMQAMAGGSFDSKLELETGSEHDNLLASFEDMRQTVKMACDELERTAQSADDANHAKSDFLANMSHELRTPMNGVMGMAEMLLDTGLNAEQNGYANRIKKSAENLLVILNDILDFSKIEANSLELEHIIFSPHDVLNDVHMLLDSLAQDANIQLDADINDETPAFLMGDPGRLRQVLLNLVGNAVKFTPAGGVKTKVRYANNAIEFDVVDTGVGIAADKLDLIFNKFAQADSSMARKFGGTGLGLSITQKLVELMGGEISVTSEMGQGSTFSFALPLVEPNTDDMLAFSHKQEEINQNKPDQTARRNAHETAVLLVEDDPVNQEVARKFLLKLGFSTVDCADDGQDAVSMFDPDVYQFILMDCQMPNMDGFEATQEIRAREEEFGIHTPIIAATANAMVGDKEKCLAAGMDDYISKPIKIDMLRSVIEPYIRFESPQETAADEVEADVFAPIDLEHLASFTDGDMVVEREFLDLFFSTASECISTLGKEIENPAEWKAMSHRLKGSTGNLGAFELMEMCQQMEMEPAALLNEKQMMLTAVRAGLEDLRDYMLQRHNTTMEDTLWLR